MILHPKLLWFPLAAQKINISILNQARLVLFPPMQQVKNALRPRLFEKLGLKAHIRWQSLLIKTSKILQSDIATPLPWFPWAAQKISTFCISQGLYFFHQCKRLKMH
jgi:hypothetical protein